MEERIEFIFTFQDSPQIIEDCPLEMKYIESEEALKEYAINSLTENEKRELVKISCCILYYNSNSVLELPEWYKQCNGKLWFTPELVTI